MKECILEGLGSCQRFFALEEGGGSEKRDDVCLHIDTCYFNEAYSVLTLQKKPYTWHNLDITFTNCYFNDVQDGVRLDCDYNSNTAFSCFVIR